MEFENKPLFEIGKLYQTRGVYDKTCKDEEFERFIGQAFFRYVLGDWGDLYESDKELNEEAVSTGEGRILGAYKYNDETKIWIITESDRSCTTILFPEEY